MIVGALGILMLLFIPDPNNTINNKTQINKTLLIGTITLLSLYGIFEIANSITSGSLLLRYQGETAGTLSGSKEVTADHFVTGRLSILGEDIDLWIDNFITGVGVGSSRFLRNLERIGVSPHVELSRLLAEHGLLGFIYSYCFFLLIPIQLYRLNKINTQRAIMLVILAIAILTTFHAAMRTFVTPLFVILSSLKITSDLKSGKNISKI